MAETGCDIFLVIYLLKKQGAARCDQLAKMHISQLTWTVSTRPG
jgi:hypothetical protein